VRRVHRRCDYGDGSSGSYSSWGLTMEGVVETGRLCPSRRPPNYVERHQNQLGSVIGKLFVLSQTVPTTDGYVQFYRWTILRPAIIGQPNKIIDHPRPKPSDRMPLDVNARDDEISSYAHC